MAVWPVYKAEMRLIALLTDFGTRDWFAGTLEGVILSISPRSRVVHVTHEIAPGDIRAGAFALRASYGYFPKGTVLMAIIDPGVGGPRQAIAAQTANYNFVGPDNGVLSWALARETIKAVHRLENRNYFLEPVSRTFHGRDIFAPAAAHLSRGEAVEKLGSPVKDFVRLPWPKVVKQDRDIRGEVVYIDRFGNAITNIAGRLLSGGKVICEIVGKPKSRCALAPFYGAVPAGQPAAVVGSSDLLEIAVNGGSAARQFGLKIGDKVLTRQSLRP